MDFEEYSLLQVLLLVSLVSLPELVWLFWVWEGLMSDRVDDGRGQCLLHGDGRKGLFRLKWRRL